MNIIKKIVILLVFLMSTALYAETLDHIVAIVNDDVITRSELRNEMHTTRLQLRAMQKSIPPDAILKKSVLDHLIDKKLQLQIAKQMNITIPDNELNTVIARIAAQNNMTTTQLFERIQNEGMSVSAYKETLREQLLLQKVQQQEIASKVVINPDEVEHLLQTKAKGQQGKVNAATRKEIENQLLHEKFEEAGRNWLSKIRGVAYIEIKPEN